MPPTHSPFPRWLRKYAVKLAARNKAQKFSSETFSIFNWLFIFEIRKSFNMYVYIYLCPCVFVCVCSKYNLCGTCVKFNEAPSESDLQIVNCAAHC